MPDQSTPAYVMRLVCQESTQTQAEPLETSRKISEFASIFESIASPLGQVGVEKSLRAWDPKK
jgi:hypothetical protein